MRGGCQCLSLEDFLLRDSSLGCLGDVVAGVIDKGWLTLGKPENKKPSTQLESSILSMLANVSSACETGNVSSR